jgi:flagellar hook-associated protein 3 FlgL
MRISSNSIYERAANQMGALRGQLDRTQQQIAANRRMLTAADDPIASARALEVIQSQSINTQFVTNRENARSSLSQVELALNGVTTLLQDVQAIAVSAGNGAYSQADRETYATQLAGRLEDLLGLANRADGTGAYLFSGFMSSTVPFTQTATGARYNGDQGQRHLQVDSARQVPVSDSGSSVFENNATGNGTFTTAAAATNSGSGIVSSGAVLNAQLLTGHQYAISFAVAGTPATTTYTITDQTASLAVPPPPPVALAVPYQSGQPITFDGITFDVKGSPADGDVFTVAPSQKQSLFTTLSDMIGVLRTPAAGSAGQAALANGLNTAHVNLNAALDNVLGVRASVGSHMKELDSLDNAGEDLNLQYSATLSGLQDLDLVKAYSSLTQQQFTLEAAQKSFKAVSGLSLFNYI